MNKRNLIIIVGIAVFFVIAVIIAVVNKPSFKTEVIAENLKDLELSATDLIKTAESFAEKQELDSAKKLYVKFINEFPNDSRILAVTNKLEDLNIKTLFSPIVNEDSFLYEVQPKDTLIKIAKENSTTVALIKRSNNLKDDMIRPGMRLKISKSKFEVFIDKSQNVLTLRSDGEIIKNYRVSTGEFNSTPVGTFKIVNKIVEPVWFKQGVAVPPQSPDNILGSRWIGFDLESYGIHGTTEPETIGQQVTQGCVRMRNQDVEELFDILPVGTEVVIVD